MLKVRITDVNPHPTLTAHIAEEGELSEIVINGKEATAEVILSLPPTDVELRSPVPGDWDLGLTDAASESRVLRRGDGVNE